MLKCGLLEVTAQLLCLTLERPPYRTKKKKTKNHNHELVHELVGTGFENCNLELQIKEHLNTEEVA